MAVTHVLEQGALRRTRNGWEDRVRCYVQDVTGNKWARRLRAFQALGIPYGSAHPSVPNLQLLEVDVLEVEGRTDAYWVDLLYRTPTEEEQADAVTGDYGPARLELRSDVAQEEVAFDVNGEPLAVVFRGPYTRPTWVGGELVEQTSTVARAYTVGRADVSRPQLAVVVSRWERRAPQAVAQQLTGAVNRSAWAGFAAKTLLCTGVESRPSDRDTGHEVSYAFRYNPDTWQARLNINLGFGAHPPPEATLGNGIEHYDVYPTYNLGRLRLDITP